MPAKEPEIVKPPPDIHGTAGRWLQQWVRDGAKGPARSAITAKEKRENKMNKISSLLELVKAATEGVDAAGEDNAKEKPKAKPKAKPQHPQVETGGASGTDFTKKIPGHGGGTPGFSVSTASGVNPTKRTTQTANVGHVDPVTKQPTSAPATPAYGTTSAPPPASPVTPAQGGLLQGINTQIGELGKNIANRTGFGAGRPHMMGYGAAGLGAAGAGLGAYGLYKLLGGGREVTAAFVERTKGLSKVAHAAGLDYTALTEKTSPKVATSTERVGTAFTDGFMHFCMQRQLSGEHVADLLEKGAEMQGQIGDECRSFMDRASTLK